MAYGIVNADVIGTSVAGSNLGAGNATLLKNRLIDAGFIINQRVYVSNTALSAGTYAHDRWKAGASGCTYTFTQGSAGVPIVITITAGSLQQVIEGCNMPDGGTFTLSWTGTAQGRVNGGGYSASPLIVTGLTAGANCTVEFNTGTCSFPQLEVGSSATGYEYRQYGQELALCQRYYQVFYGSASGTPLLARNNAASANQGPALNIWFKTSMRSAPTGAVLGTWGVTNCGQPTVSYTGTQAATLYSNSITSGDCLFLANASTAGASMSSEL